MKTSGLIIFIAAVSLALGSCVKEDTIHMMKNAADEGAAVEATSARGLVRNSDGTWTADGRRVPLVGAGRFVNELSPSVVRVLGSTEGVNNVTDLDLSNTADVSGISVDVIGNQILSVKDMYRTYASGQRVGFVLGNKAGSVLEVNVLSMFVITLYKDGAVVGSPYTLGEVASDGSSTLDLDVVKLSSGGNSGMQAISVEADYAFDEVALSVAGVGADIGDSGLSVYYAFVGDTPEEYIYTSDGASIKGGLFQTNWTDVVGAEAVIDENDDSGVYIPPLYPAHFTVDFGENLTFAEGTELGFVYTQGTALNLSLFNHVGVTPYDSGWNEIEQDALSSESLLGVSALGGGKGAYSITTSTDRTRGLKFSYFSLGVDVGAMTIDRVYRRAPIVIDPTSYFTAAEKVSTSKTYYRFMDPIPDASGKENGSISLNVSGGASVQGNLVTGMQPGKTYEVEVIYSGTSGSFTSVTEITCEESASAPADIVYMTEDNGFRLASTESPSGITLFSYIDNRENIVNEDITDAAVYVKALDLINIKTVIAAVETADGSPVETTGETRVGFALQVNSEILSLSALDFFRIVLYNDGNEVRTYIPANNQSVSLGLIAGSSQIMVSAVTDEEFDRVELQTSGLLGLALSSMKIYYGFYEPTGGDDTVGSSGIREFCTEMLSTASHGLWLDYGESDFALAGAACFMDNMTDMLDGDRDSYAVLYNTVQAGGGTRISVHFDPVKSRQWLGMIISDTESILSAELLRGTRLNAYNDGILVNSVSDDFSGLLDLSLISNSDMSYVEIYPVSEGYVDELELEIRGLVGLADGLKIYGVYLRPDEDGDGIPDCSEDEKAEDDPDSMTADASEYHICSSDKAVFRIQGGEIGRTYSFVFTSADDSGISFNINSVLPRQREFILYPDAFSSVGMGPGHYRAAILPAGEQADPDLYPHDIDFFLHPDMATWTGNAGNSRWNDWDNWREGAPWNCTNVLIPGGCTSYPAILADDNAACHNIQFAPGAEATGTNHLSYGKAWVNISLPEGRYSMFSSPLKETCTGDMFISTYAGTAIPEKLLQEDGTPLYSLCWLPLDEENYKVDRFEPAVYQRVWNRAVQNVTDNGVADIEPDSDFWSEPFNLVSDVYEAGKGILIRPGEEETGSGTVVFCLPKEYEEYEYYDIDTKTYTGKKDNIVRTEEYSGRFIYENDRGEAVFPLHVLLTNERPSEMYLAGNPFMCHIDLQKFFEMNPAVSQVMFMEKTGASYGYRTVDAAEAAGQTVAPAEGFLVKVGGIYAESSRFRLYIHFTEDMMTLGN